MRNRLSRLDRVITRLTQARANSIFWGNAPSRVLDSPPGRPKILWPTAPVTVAILETLNVSGDSGDSTLSAARR